MKIAYLLILILSASFALDSELTKALEGKVIVLDPGHGDPDNGLVYPGPAGSSPTDGIMGIQAREDRIVHRIARILEQMLGEHGAIVHMTAGDMSLMERANFANKKNAEIFVSIHTNGGGSSAKRVESFYGELNYVGSGGDKENDIKLCEKINPPVVDILLSNNGGIKSDTASNPGELTVLRNTNMPACLIEVEFLSYNPKKNWAQNENCYEDAKKKAQEAYNTVEKYCEMLYYFDASSKSACKDEYRKLILEENTDVKGFGKCRLDCYNKYAMDSYIKSSVECNNGRVDYLTCTKRCDNLLEDGLSNAFCHRSCENFVSQGNPYIGEYTFCKLYTNNNCGNELAAASRYCFQSRYTDSGLNSCQEECNKMLNIKSIYDNLAVVCSSKIYYEGLIKFEGKEFTSHAHLMESKEYQKAAADALFEGIAEYFKNQ
ncbi:N-acetylmuramoyl-L-alanine amidase [Candidatus Micrarchaeota archaeon]|nr:N-acetylmuramoyl-L-alanine amidase [Candidatus Micrarchaeota archaeon]